MPRERPGDKFGTSQGHPGRLGRFIRYRPKGVFGKGIGNSTNASEMRQKYVKVGLVLLGKDKRSKMRQKCVKILSKMRQKCAEHLCGRTPLGRYRFMWKFTFKGQNVHGTDGTDDGTDGT